MHSIDSLRQQIEAIDREMAKLFFQRLSLVEEIAKEKAKEGLPLRNEAVEEEKIDRRREEAKDRPKEYQEAEEAFFRNLFELSRRFQEPLLLPKVEKALVELYTDGACSGNPGPGGYGGILRFRDPSGVWHEQEYSQGYRLTTNNRMELMAVIHGLKALKKPCSVELFSDSRYIVDAYEKGWVKRWKENDWYRDEKKKEKAKNVDLFLELESLLNIHSVSFHWVKGHAHHELNNRADALAVKASADQAHYEIDPYEQEVRNDGLG